MRLGLSSPKTILAAGLGVLAVGVALGNRIHFDSDVLNMLPQKDPLVGEFRRVVSEFGAAETLLVVERIPDPQNLEPALALADALEDELKKSPFLSRVDARLQDPLRLAEEVLAHGLLFLDEEGRQELAQRLSAQGLARRAREVREALDTPQAVMTKELVTRDLLGVLPLILRRLSTSPQSPRVDTSSGYYLSADHSLLVILAYPKAPAQDIGFDEKLFADLEARVSEAKKRVASEWELDASELPSVEFGGGHRIALDDASLIRGDTIVNSLTSLLGVSVLLLLAFRRWHAVGVMAVPLAAGLALTFAFAGLFFPTLSSAAAGFSALLIGLGIDFSIVLYSRYCEVRAAGIGLAEAWEETASETGPAIFLGAFTTLATFYAFLATRFAGLAELGLLTGTGIVFLAVAALVLVPALTTFSRKPLPVACPLPWLPAEKFLGWVRARRHGVLAGTLALCLGSALLLPRLTFDDDVRHLRSPANRGVAVQEEVAAAFGQSFNAMVIRLEAPDELSLLQKTQSFVSAVQDLKNRGVVARVESVATWVPPLSHQKETLTWLATHGRDPGQVVAELRQALDREGLVADAFAPGLELVRRMLSLSEPVTVGIWRGTPLEGLVERSMHHGDGYVSTAVTVYAPPGRWRREVPPELAALVKATPGASLVGVNVLAQHLRQVVRHDALRAAALGLVAVLTLLLAQLRRWDDALLCLLPVAAGLVLAGGVAAAVGLALNPLNVFVTTMVIGIGSDYGIHLVHRVREDPAATGGTVRAVVLAALTTAVGFGSLMTSHYPGLASVGWMTVLGVCLACLAAIVLVPLLRRTHEGQAP